MTRSLRQHRDQLKGKRRLLLQPRLASRLPSMGSGTMLLARMP